MQVMDDHLRYLVVLREAKNAREEISLENIAKFAQPESLALIVEHTNGIARTDYLTHAEEIVSFFK